MLKAKDGDNEKDVFDNEPLAKQIEDSDRGHWNNPCDFFVSCLGYAVGLGNVWRFPFLCYQHGGGSFLIPYFTMLFAAGLPVFFLEIAIGQYAGVGPIKVFGRLVPVLRGLGYAVVNVGLLLSFFYIVVVSWALWYAIASVGSELEWAKCGHVYNTEHCFSDFDNSLCQRNDSALVFWQNKCTPLEKVCEHYGLERIEPHCRNESTLIPFGELDPSRSSSVIEYWSRYVLGGADDHDWTDYGTPRWQSVFCLFVAWSLVAVCLIKGVKSSGKVVYFTSLFPYAVLLILAFRGFTMEGALNGLQYYVTPKWDKILTLDIWVDAATQVIFSLGPACGCVITLSSYNQFNRNCHRDAILIAISNCMTSVFSGLVVFSVLGFMAHDAGKAMDDVVNGGPGLAFIVYPQIVTRMAGSQIWAFLFFAMLITLALGSIFGAFETVISAVCDQWPEMRAQKSWIVVGTSSTMFLLGLCFTTGGGIHMFTVFNASAPSWNLLLFALLEVLIIGWFYGAEDFIENLEEMGIQLSGLTRGYWLVCWRFLTPTVLSTLLIMAWINFGHIKYNEYVYPLGIQVFGYIVTGCTICWLLVFALIEIRRRWRLDESLSKSLTRPTANWKRQGYGTCRVADESQDTAVIP